MSSSAHLEMPSGIGALSRIRVLLNPQSRERSSWLLAHAETEGYFAFVHECSRGVAERRTVLPFRSGSTVLMSKDPQHVVLRGYEPVSVPDEFDGPVPRGVVPLESFHPPYWSSPGSVVVCATTDEGGKGKPRPTIHILRTSRRTRTFVDNWWRLLICALLQSIPCVDLRSPSMVIIT